jgi:hypothetical protein
METMELEMEYKETTLSASRHRNSMNYLKLDLFGYERDQFYKKKIEYKYASCLELTQR